MRKTNTGTPGDKNFKKFRKEKKAPTIWTFLERNAWPGYCDCRRCPFLPITRDFSSLSPIPTVPMLALISFLLLHNVQPQSLKQKSSELPSFLHQASHRPPSELNSYTVPTSQPCTLTQLMPPAAPLFSALFVTNGSVSDSPLLLLR